MSYNRKYYVKSDEKPRQLADLFIHPRLLLPDLPSVTAPPESVSKILHGHSANLPEFSKNPLVKVFKDQTRLIAIARRIAGTLFHPKVVLGL